MLALDGVSTERESISAMKSYQNCRDQTHAAPCPTLNLGSEVPDSLCDGLRVTALA